MLTFAFPEPLRDDLTFSTYHDRPEELPGYRISGTIPQARPNKPALLAQGIVADLTQGTFEPPVEPAGWAMTLANWLIRHDPIDEADWSSHRRAGPRDWRDYRPTGPWSGPTTGSNHLHAYPLACRSRTAPEDPAGWSSLASFARWLDRIRAGRGVGPVPEGPGLVAVGVGRGDGSGPEARAALVSHLAMLRDAWRGDGQPSELGRGGRRLVPGSPEADERDRSIASILRACPRPARPVVRPGVAEGADAGGAGVASSDSSGPNPATDRGMLLPLEASAAVAAILAGGRAGLLRVDRRGSRLAGPPGGRPRPFSTPSRRESPTNPRSCPGLPRSPRPRSTRRLRGKDGLAWALRRGPLAPAWLGPALRPILADPGRQQGPGKLSATGRPDDLQADLARAVLAINRRTRACPTRPFAGAVEALLLPLAPRPVDPSWAETYLRRTPSGLDLLRRLVAPEYRKLGLLAWIDSGEVEGRSLARAGRPGRCLPGVCSGFVDSRP